MSLRLYLIIMALVSVFAWTGWLVIVHSIDPTKTGFLGFLLFYLTLGMSVLASTTLIGTLIRVSLKKNEVVYRHVVRSLRQGILFTGLFMTSLLLASAGLLAWWVMLLLVLIAAIVELSLLGLTESTGEHS